MKTEWPNELTMILGFDPLTTPETAEIFRSAIGRAFYLCWRRNHIVSQHFNRTCLGIVRTIESMNPQTVKELEVCLERHLSLDITRGDIARSAPEILPYLLGEKHVTYEVTVAAAEKASKPCK